MQHRFDPMLKRYAAGEDTDLTYRLSRSGLLLAAIEAKAHHLEVGENSRLSLKYVTAIGALNPMALHVRYSTNLRRSYKATRTLLLRRFIIEFVKDVYYRDIKLPRCRGIALAMRHMRHVFKMNPGSIDTEYPRLQEYLLQSN